MMNVLLNEMIALLDLQKIIFPSKAQTFYGRYYIIFETYKTAMLNETDRRFGR